MPNRDRGSDNLCEHSDSDTHYQQDTIPGQFNFVHILIYPTEENYYRVEVKKKEGVPSFGPIRGSQIIQGEASLARLVSQTALNADIASRVLQENKHGVSNCEERLRQIQQIRERFSIAPNAKV